VAGRTCSHPEGRDETLVTFSQAQLHGRHLLTEGREPLHRRRRSPAAGRDVEGGVGGPSVEYDGHADAVLEDEEGGQREQCEERVGYLRRESRVCDCEQTVSATECS